MWKRAVLFIAVVLAVVLGAMAFPDSYVTFLDKSVSLTVASSSSLPHPEFAINGLALSGRWEGPGFAEVFVMVNGQRFLVMDTRQMPSVVELADFGTPFEVACIETCAMPTSRIDSMFVVLHGPGVLSISKYHYRVPSSPAGLVFCPNCKTAKEPVTPDHSLLLPVILLLLAVVGSHVAGHVCKKGSAKRVALWIFLGSFVVLGGVFGLSVVAPTAAFAVTAKMTASVLAALGVVGLLGVVAFEVLSVHNKEGILEKEHDVWRELEEAEDAWRGRR